MAYQKITLSFRPQPERQRRQVEEPAFSYHVTNAPKRPCPVILRRRSRSRSERLPTQQRRNGALYCFVDDHPIESDGDVEFHHIKPFSEDGPTEIANIGAVCKDHRRIRTLSSLSSGISWQWTDFLNTRTSGS